MERLPWNFSCLTRSQSAQRIDVVADDLGGAHQRYGEHQAHRSPDPRPEKHYLGIKDIHGKKVQTNHREQDHGDPGLVHYDRLSLPQTPDFSRPV